MRELFAAKGVFRSKVIAGQGGRGGQVPDYFDWEEPVATAPSHRVLAMRRGENEGFLTLRIAPPEEEALRLLEAQFVTGQRPCRRAGQGSRPRQLQAAAVPVHGDRDPARDRRNAPTRRPSGSLPRTCGSCCWRPPLGQKNVLAIDPGFRTGCKVVCLDRQGKLLHNDTIFPHFSEEGKVKAAETLRAARRAFQHRGHRHRQRHGRPRDGGLRPRHSAFRNIQVIMVNESGASVYSASRGRPRGVPRP